GEMGIEAGFLSAPPVLLLSPSREGDENHLFAPGLLADSSCRLITVQPGHGNVHQNYVRQKFGGSFHCRDPVLGNLHFVTILFQQARQCLGGLSSPESSASVSNSGRSAVTGSCTVNSLPRFMPSLRTSALPPCSSTNRCTNVKPKPRPPSLRVK